MIYCSSTRFVLLKRLRHGSYANGDIIDCLDLHTCGRLDLDVSTLASCFSSAEIIKKETSVSTRPTNQGNDLTKLLLVPDYEQIQRRARCRGAGMDLRDHWHARQPVWQPRQRFRTIEGRSSSVQVSDFDDAMKLAYYIVLLTGWPTLCSPTASDASRRAKWPSSAWRTSTVSSMRPGNSAYPTKNCSKRSICGRSKT